VATNCTHSANIHSALYANYFRRITLCYKKNNTDTPKTDFISIRSRQTNTVWFQLSQTQQMLLSHAPQLPSSLAVRTTVQVLHMEYLAVLVTQDRHQHHITVSVCSTTVVFTDSSVTECRLANSNRHFERHPRRLIKSPISLIACTSV